MAVSTIGNTGTYASRLQDVANVTSKVSSAADTVSSISSVASAASDTVSISDQGKALMEAEQSLTNEALKSQLSNIQSALISGMTGNGNDLATASDVSDTAEEVITTAAAASAADAATTTDSDTETTTEATSGTKEVEAKSPVKSLAYGALGQDHPEDVEKSTDDYYTAGQVLSALGTVGTVVSVLI